MGTIIEVKNLSKRFNKNVVLNNINLNIPEGKIFGLIGISGSGKTTLLNSIVGFYRPNNGQVLYQGKRIDRGLSNVKKDFGFATQTNSFYPKLTIKENLHYFGTLYGLDNKTITANTNRILGLLKLENAHNTIAENLSGGMKRRLDLACALIHYPKILILDEPTEELDPKLRGEMIDLVKQISATGTTVIVTSHLLWEMERLCDEVAIIHNTQVLNVGSVEQLRDLYGKHEELHLETHNKQYNQLLASIDKKLITKALTKGDRLILTSPLPAEELLHEVLKTLEKHKEKITMIDIHRPSLNDIFLGLVEEKNKEDTNDKKTS
ncbi:MAG: ABC transporter ATP-binding protein [Nanoarchaeota archaeon]|nr:ABC transporter ATP-binding protein [Nanoarchaeota archaeon]